MTSNEKEFSDILNYERMMAEAEARKKRLITFFFISSLAIIILIRK